MSRADGRANDQLRPIKFTRNWLNNAEGSVLVEFGNTRALNELVSVLPPPVVMSVALLLLSHLEEHSNPSVE